MKTLEVLISTMHQPDGDYSLLEHMNVQTDAIVVNQCDKENTECVYHRGKRVTWINTKDRGLSKSRNCALANATAELCLLADDDEVLADGYENIILKDFNSDTNASIFRYRVEGIEASFKQYPKSEADLGFIKSMKIASVELVIKRQDIIDKKIKFDELIGAGTKYMMGEENAFCWECLRKKLKIRYIPSTIAYLHIGNSSWFHSFNKEFFIGRGASFSAMSRKVTLFLILQYAVRKTKEYKKEASIFSAIRWMLSGSRMYCKDMRKEKKYG